MILQQLYEDAANILGELHPAMYRLEAVRWVVPLTPDGQLAGSVWVPLLDASGKRGKTELVPYQPRTVKIDPSLIVDYPAYVLGRDEPDKHPEAKHKAYRALVKRCLDATDNPLVRAVDLWLDRWDAGLETPPADLSSQDRIAFRVGEGGDWPTNELAVQSFWASAKQKDAQRGECLITGIEGPIESSLPGMLKGVPNGQMAGVAIVSANSPAFESFNRERAATSPISRDAAERFTKALNHLLAGKDTRQRVGDLVYVFWTKNGGDTAVPSALGGFTDFSKLPVSASQARDMIRSMWDKDQRAALKSTDPEAFYALALSASGARAVVRDWLQTTLPVVRENLQRWVEAQAIVAPDGGESRYYGIYQLAASLYRKEDASKETLLREGHLLIRAALHGEMLPDALLSQAVLRCRAEQKVTQRRAALIKAYFVRRELDSEKQKEIATLMSKLDPDRSDLAYQYGRLLAELDAVQYAALGPVNTTLVDRYYGAASTSPGIIFPMIVSMATKAHLPKIRKTRPPAYIALSKRLEEIMSRIDGFKTTLTLSEQALFSLGFYHQRADDRSRLKSAGVTLDEGADSSDHENGD